MRKKLLAYTNGGEFCILNGILLGPFVKMEG